MLHQQLQYLVLRCREPSLLAFHNDNPLLLIKNQAAFTIRSASAFGASPPQA